MNKFNELNIGTKHRKVLRFFVFYQVNLNEYGIELIGGNLSEAPMVYKDINDVITAQTDLVKVLAKFTPKIVRVVDTNRKESRAD